MRLLQVSYGVIQSLSTTSSSNSLAIVGPPGGATWATTSSWAGEGLAGPRGQERGVADPQQVPKPNNT